MKKNYSLKKPVSVRNTSVMFILNGGRKEIKEFNVVSKKVNDQLRMRLTLTKPISLDFVSWSIPGKGAKQWINLGKEFKEIAANDMSGSFLGSHITYMDLAEPYIDDYEYKFLGETEITVGGVKEACYKIEARQKVQRGPYIKNHMYIRKSDFFMVQVDFFEKKGHTKSLYLEKIEKINGILAARKVTMSRVGSDDKTIIVLKSIEYDVPVQENTLIPVGAYQN